MAARLVETPIRATLHELSLQSPDPQFLAQSYSNAFGYEFIDDGHGLLGTARDRRLRIAGGQAKALGYAAYALADVEELFALRGRLAEANVDYRQQSWPGFSDALLCDDPDGNAFVFGIAEPAIATDLTGTAGRPARVQHVVFASTDPQRLINFYTDVLAFTLSDRVVDGEGGLRTAFLRCSHEHHSLAVFKADENRLDHHCYEAGDWNLIRDWADHFASTGIALKWGPGRHGPGNNLFVFIHDPDGNWVELSAELEQVLPDRPVGEWPHEERTLNSWGMGLLRS